MYKPAVALRLQGKRLKWAKLSMCPVLRVARLDEILLVVIAGSSFLESLLVSASPGHVPGPRLLPNVRDTEQRTGD